MVIADESAGPAGPGGPARAGGQKLATMREISESLVVKVLIVGFLIVVLLVPLGMIYGVIGERMGRRDEVVEEVGRTWGKPQVIGAMVLTVPYAVTYVDASGKSIVSQRFARFLPETLTIEGRLAPEIRHRSLFEVPVYTAHVTMRGHFRRPDFRPFRIEETAVRWENAALSLGVGDLGSVNQGLSITWQGAALTSGPAPAGVELFTQGIEAPVPGLRDAAADLDLPFAVVMDLKGSKTLSVQGSGRMTTVRLASSWPHPGFGGAFLPDVARVTDAGFEAEWRLSQFGRGYPQAWLESDVRVERLTEAASASRFDVNLVTPVDIYQQAERSAKYGVLFILLTFATCLLIELFQRVRLHPIQYLLVGAALCLFYLLLLSLSEHIGFGPAYLTAAGATVGVLTMYSAHVLGGWRQGLRTALATGALYSFLYVLLQLEDYALLTGAVGLFLMLAALMYVTRRVNWYQVGRENQAV